MYESHEHIGEREMLQEKVIEQHASWLTRSIEAIRDSQHPFIKTAPAIAGAGFMTHIGMAMNETVQLGALAHGQPEKAVAIGLLEAMTAFGVYGAHELWKEWRKDNA